MQKFILVLFSASAGFAHAYDNGAPNSRLPPLGWSSWEALGAGDAHPVRDYCDSNSVMAAADAYHESGLYAAGYRHFHLDDCWSIVARTSKGEIQPDPTRFPPTAAGANDGMTAVIAYVHSKNLSFGLYTAGGTAGCMKSRAGSRGHWVQDAKSFAAWGVDYVKMDWCGGEDVHGSYGNMSKALNATGRAIHFNMCEWGVENPWEWGFDVAHSWRISGDHSASWASTKRAISKVVTLPHEYGGKPWGWNDLDMLQTGNGAQSGYDPHFEPPHMSLAESISEFSMWAIAASPMLVTTPIMNCTAKEASADFAARQYTGDDDVACTVGLVTQLSHRTKCILGESYGCYGTQANKTMWVGGQHPSDDEGCRGVFTCDGVLDNQGRLAEINCDPMTPKGGNPYHTCACKAAAPTPGPPGPTPPGPAPQPNPPKGKCVAALNEMQKKILLNTEVIAINQDITPQGFPINGTNSTVWARKLSDGSVAIALYNEHNDAVNIGIRSFAALGVGWTGSTKVKVRDLWAHTDNGTVTGALPDVTVAAHLTVVLRLTPIAPAPGGIFNVVHYGATGDGETKDTDAVRRAAAAVAAAGGGTLLFPQHNKSVYLTGAFNLTSHCVLEVQAGATVLGSPDGDDWPLVDAATLWPQFGHGSDCVPGTAACARMHQAFVLAWQVVNLTLTGSGTIDAGATKDTWWKCANDLTQPPCSGHSRPHLLGVYNASDVSTSGLTFKNSPDWTLHFSSVDNLRVKGVTVQNPHDAPNADGIDLDCVVDAVVEDSFFDVGDDALCVKSGIDFNGRHYAHPSRDIVFRNNRIGSGHGITIGSETSGSVFNVTFENIDMTGTINGPRIKSERGRGGVVDGITFRNIMAHDVRTMMSVTLNYHAGLAPTNKTATPVLRNVLLENVTFVGGGHAGLFDGLPESHIENVTLRDCDFSGGKTAWSKCDYVDGGVCEGSTNACPPCFTDNTRAAAAGDEMRS